MKKGLTEIVLILDKSGSMGGTESDVIGGLNTFIEEQKKLPGDAKFTLIQFDTNIIKQMNRISIQIIDKFTKKDYRPSGGTALLEAMWKTIDEVGLALSEEEEFNRPEKVMIVVMTDGQENQSNYPYNDKKELGEKIKHQQDKYNWEFVFLGANFDVFGEAQSMNFKSANTTSYVSSADLGVRGFADMNLTVSAYRTH